MWWYDYEGITQPYQEIPAGETRQQWTYATHPWEAKDLAGSNTLFTTGGVEVFVTQGSDHEQTIKIE